MPYHANIVKGHEMGYPRRILKDINNQLMPMFIVC
jgi:hypothetical protein